MFGIGVFTGAAIATIVLVGFYEFHLPKLKAEKRKAKRVLKCNYITREGAMSYFNNATESNDIDLGIALINTLDAQEAYKKDQQTTVNC